MLNYQQNQQRGAVLLIAILMVVIVVSIATYIYTLLAINFDFTKIMVVSDKLAAVAPRIEALFSTQIIKERQEIVQQIRVGKYFIDGEHRYDNFKINGILSTGTVVDQTGLFNLNSLQNPELCNKKNKFTGDKEHIIMEMMGQTFQRLIENVAGRGVDSAALVRNVQLSLCPKEQARDNRQQGLGQPFVSVSELVLITGFTPKLVEALRPYITAYRVTAFSNIYFSKNTIHPMVLAALAGTNTDSADDAIETYIKSWGSFTGEVSASEQELVLESDTYENWRLDKKKNAVFTAVVNNLLLDPSVVLNRGAYFLIQSYASNDLGNYSLFSMLYVKNKRVKVMWRSKGAY